MCNLEEREECTNFCKRHVCIDKFVNKCTCSHIMINDSDGQFLINTFVCNFVLSASSACHGSKRIEKHLKSFEEDEAAEAAEALKQLDEKDRKDMVSVLISICLSHTV